MAQTLGMTVTLGAWISQDEKHNDAELNTAIELVRRYTNIDRLLIGNEALYREDTTLARLVDYMTLARRQVSVPVSTSEAWSTWVYIPELARQSDFIAAHVLPFWQTITAEYATSEVMARAEQLHQLLPDKPILLSEVGLSVAATRQNAGRLALVIPSGSLKSPACRCSTTVKVVSDGVERVSASHFCASDKTGGWLSRGG